MKPLNRAKELNKESANYGSTPNNKSVIHKPTKKAEIKAKEKAFGKPVVHAPKKPNRPKKKKNKKAGVPLSAKVGAGVAGVALVGGSVAAIVHNMNSGNRNVQDANRHSDDSDLNFGSSKDSSSSSKNNKSKLAKDKNDKKNNKKDKNKDKKSEDALSDLLGDDSSEFAGGSSSKSDKSSDSDKSDLDSLIDGLSGGSADADKGLKELAKKANKSVADASKLGGKDASKGSKASNNETPKELPNAQKDDSKGKGSASALTDLAYKPNATGSDQKAGKDSGTGEGRNTNQRTEARQGNGVDSNKGNSENSDSTRPSRPSNGGNSGNTNPSRPDQGNAGNNTKPDNPNHGNTGGNTGGNTKPNNPDHGNTGGDTKPDNPDHGNTGGNTKPDNPDHGNTGGNTKPDNPDHGNTGGDTKPDNPDHGNTGGDTKPDNPDHGNTGGDTKPDNPDHGNTGGNTNPDQPSNPTYPYQNVPDGTTKSVQFVTTDGTVVGTGTLSKNGNSVNVENIPGGYKLSDVDSEGHSAQLLQWPDQITVVSDGTSQPDNPTPTYPYQNVPDGTTKNVQFVTADGAVVGTGTLSKNGNSVNVSNIPSGYKLSDVDSEGHSAQLLQWPDQITVVSDGTSQPNTPKYPAESVPDGTTKEIQFVTSDGSVVGTGTLSKNGNSVNVSNIPGGYKLADLDSEGHSAQLLKWPNQITVVSDGTSQPDNPSQPGNPKYPAENVPSGTTKSVQFVTANGTVVGTGTLTKDGNSVRISDIPGNYDLSDLDSEGHSPQLLQWPDQITVVSKGNSNKPSQPSNPTYPFLNVPDGTSKEVQFVTSDGSVVGTGQLTRNGNSIGLSGIPSGYKLSDVDSEGHSAQLLQWPNQITVVSDGTNQPSDPNHSNTGGNTSPSQPNNPTYPFLNVPDGTSKNVQFVASDGSVVGTGQLTRNGNSVHLSGIPDGYKLSDEDSQGHSVQLYQWPNQITVVSDGTSQPSNPTHPTTPSYPAERVSDGTSKSIQFVTSDGTVVGTGTLSKTNGMVKLDGIPGNYKLADEDSSGHSAQLLQWPDRIVVASM